MMSGGRLRRIEDAPYEAEIEIVRFDSGRPFGTLTFTSKTIKKSGKHKVANVISPYLD